MKLSDTPPPTFRNWECRTCGEKVETPIPVSGYAHACPHHHGARVVWLRPVKS